MYHAHAPIHYRADCLLHGSKDAVFYQLCRHAMLAEFSNHLAVDVARRLNKYIARGNIGVARFMTAGRNQRFDLDASLGTQAVCLFAHAMHHHQRARLGNLRQISTTGVPIQARPAP